MGSCATKPKTFEGKAPEEEVATTTPIEAPKVAHETTLLPNVVVAASDQEHEKLIVEEAKVDQPHAIIAEEVPTDAIVQKNIEATPELNNKEKEVEKEVEEKIVEEEKPSAPAAEKNVEVNNAKVVEKTIEIKNTEVGKGTTEVKINAEEEKPIQS
uniref:Uncharacterized protein n=1 Tax=Leersia perrieri TaxID=77586 RepID=A0A0D9WL76_9ORYZ